MAAVNMEVDDDIDIKEEPLDEDEFEPEFEPVKVQCSVSICCFGFYHYIFFYVCLFCGA